MAGALPDYYVLSGNFGLTIFTGNAENENADLSSHITPGIYFNGMKVIDRHPGINCALPEGLNCRTAIDASCARWKKCGIFSVEAGNGRAISSIDGSYKFN